MKDYGFLLAHGYEIKKGYINDCESEEDAKAKILAGDYDDIMDTFDTDDLTVGYEVVEMWVIE